LIDEVRPMAETMKAAVIHKAGDVRIETVEVPKPGPGEVLVAMKAVGVCGSDVHYYKAGRIGDYAVKEPMILGHECAGEIVELGEGVDNVKIGERVAVEPGATCGRCEFCKSGRYNLCRDVVFYATPPVDGAFCEYQTAAAHLCFPIPEGMSFEEGAMIEPLAVGMHACNRADVKPGDSVAILGAGPIGLLCLQAARARGGAPLIAADIDENRLEMAAQFGAAHVINAAESDAAAEIVKLTDGLGADVVFETAGAVQTTQQTVAAAKNGGRIVWVGMPEEDRFPVDVIRAICKEVAIYGLFRYANCYPPAIKLVADGRIDVKSMITTRFKLEQVPEALEYAVKHGRECIKIMINIS